MSKIDEFIKDYRDHPITALQTYNKVEWYNEPTDGLMVVTVDDLEQLRPYVELAEMIVDEDITKDIEFQGREDYLRLGKLFQQIKEQQ